MTKLSVNVNKIATIRNARGHNMPNVAKVTQDIINFGAQGITIHPRPDQRHIRTSDVYELAQLLKEVNYSKKEKVEFNIEGYPNLEFMNIITEVRPDQCTLVPDGPDVITSNAGWDCIKNKELLIKVVHELKEIGVRSSLFIDVNDMNDEQLSALMEIKPDRVELYTEEYAKHYGTDKQSEVTEKYKEVAIKLYDLGLQLNAGHDLSLENIHFLIKEIPVIEEVSIGHALVCESLYMGFEKVIGNYLKLMSLSEIE